MNKKLIKDLVLHSYSGNELSEKRVNEIMRKLNRSNLKMYLKALKSAEKKNSVLVFLPNVAKKDYQKKLNSIFPDKKVSYIIDKSLIAGIKIVENDRVTQASIENNLDEISEFINKSYD